MRSGTKSFLTMLLTAVPLLAVPALAIFGIPQFAPMSASPSSEVEERSLPEDDFDESDELLSEIDPWAGEDRSSGAKRRLGGKPRPRRFDQHADRDETVPEAVLGESIDEQFDAGFALRERRDTSRQPASDPSPDENDRASARRSWKSAVRELNRLGIQNYRLEPGSRKETFLFRCVLDTPSSPRVVRQFEAEAEEPLDAVAEVIRQAREHVRAPLGN